MKLKEKNITQHKTKNNTMLTTTMNSNRTMEKAFYEYDDVHDFLREYQIQLRDKYVCVIEGGEYGDTLNVYRNHTQYMYLFINYGTPQYDEYRLTDDDLCMFCGSGQGQRTNTKKYWLSSMKYGSVSFVERIYSNRTEYNYNDELVSDTTFIDDQISMINKIKIPQAIHKFIETAKVNINQSILILDSLS